MDILQGSVHEEEPVPNFVAERSKEFGVLRYLGSSLVKEL